MLSFPLTHIDSPLTFFRRGMASKFRNLISVNVSSFLKISNSDFKLTHRDIAAQLKVKLDRNHARIYFQSPVKLLSENETDVSGFVQNFPTDNYLTGIDTLEKGKINYFVDTKTFTEQVIRTTLTLPPDYQWTKNALFPETVTNVVVEFSSPNIAKPFHIGHLRSTIIGNFVANINQKVGNSVKRINYLGDWGTQFGLLVAGLEASGKNFRDLSLSDLLKVYIEANRKAEADETFMQKALDSFKSLESGDSEKLQIWDRCRQLTLEELNKNYSKLNVAFDCYHGESMYGQKSLNQVLTLLENRNLIKVTDDGRTVIPLERTNVTVKKSDGSSLYITRDIAAAIDRNESFNFDKMFYVVDNSQGTHFNNLFEVLRRLGCEWSGDCHHVKFGKIMGMSTRRGQMVLMSDILEEATARMRENQDKSANTRVAEEDREAVAEAVGVSALIVADLGQRRTKDYEWAWDRALSDSGDTGVKLQYTHARLTSLLEKCQELDTELDTSLGDLLTESIAVELVWVISRYDEVLASSYTTLEAVTMVKFLFQLCNTTSKALKLLPVKNAETRDLAAARIKLFAAAKLILADGMTVLGIRPLDRI